jgi:photosystem I subunit 3
MSRPILCTVALASAAALLYSNGFPFVTPRGVSTPVPPKQQPTAAPEPFQVIDQTPAAEVAPDFTKWVGAGLLAGLVAAVMSAAPAEAGTPATTDPKAILERQFGKGQFERELNPTKGVFPIKSRINRQERGYIKGFQAKYWNHLEPCKDSKKFKKLIKDELFKIGAQQKKFPKGGIQWERWNDMIAQTKRRQEAYGTRWCGPTGEPHVIPTGEATRGGILEGAGIFLYIAGWIGFSGRRYIQKKGYDNGFAEVLVDVPLAVPIMLSGFSWPVQAWQEIVNGQMANPEHTTRNGGGGFKWAQAPGYGGDNEKI